MVFSAQVNHDQINYAISPPYDCVAKFTQSYQTGRVGILNDLVFVNVSTFYNCNE